MFRVDMWCADAQRLIKSLPEYDVCGEMMDGNRMWDVVQECEQTGNFEDSRYAAVTTYSVQGLSVYNYMWGPSEFSCTGTLKGHDSTCLLKDIDVPTTLPERGEPSSTPSWKALQKESQSKSK